MKESCEKIQHFGAFKDETGSRDVLDPETCLNNIKKTLAEVKVEYVEAEKRLKSFYERWIPSED